MSGKTADASLRARALKVIPNGMYGHESTRLLPASFPQFFSKADGALAQVRAAEGTLEPHPVVVMVLRMMAH